MISNRNIMPQNVVLKGYYLNILKVFDNIDHYVRTGQCLNGSRFQEGIGQNLLGHKEGKPPAFLSLDSEPCELQPTPLLDSEPTRI